MNKTIALEQIENISLVWRVLWYKIKNDFSIYRTCVRPTRSCEFKMQLWNETIETEDKDLFVTYLSMTV